MNYGKHIFIEHNTIHILLYYLSRRNTPPNSVYHEIEKQTDDISIISSFLLKGNTKTIKKDIFGDTVIKDNKGNKKTVKKGIFGNLVAED